MNNIAKENNNNGFSLVELIVVVAIMVIMTGAITLSVSLITGSEAKKACQNLSAYLNEVKTGSMSRYSEDMNVVYVSDASSYDWADRDGFYVVKQMSTMELDESTKMPKETPLGVEHRYLCNNRVEMIFDYEGATEPYAVDSSTDGFGIKFDRSTGLYESIEVDVELADDGTVSGAGAVKVNPKTLEVKSGLRTYVIKFDGATGKHVIEK